MQGRGREANPREETPGREKWDLRLEMLAWERGAGLNLDRDEGPEEGQTVPGPREACRVGPRVTAKGWRRHQEVGENTWWAQGCWEQVRGGF